MTDGCGGCAGRAGASAAAHERQRGMRLHRLVPTNYRGIVHRDIQLFDSGVVVICGANEVGKNIDDRGAGPAADSKDRSTKKEVKQVKPTHADLGAEVLAEISTGRYRFTHRKTVSRIKRETELTIVEPRREQLTGDEAHERVLAMLAETVDKDLWRAAPVAGDFHIRGRPFRDAMPCRARSIWPQVTPRRCPATNPCSSNGSMPNTRATSLRPAVRTGSGLPEPRR